MRSRFTSSRVLAILALSLTAFLLVSANGNAAGPKKGLNPEAGEELVASGVTKYLDQFEPISSADVGDGWTKHTFDPAGGAGPICIAGTSYSVFTRPGKKEKKFWQAVLVDSSLRTWKQRPMEP